MEIYEWDQATTFRFPKPEEKYEGKVWWKKFKAEMEKRVDSADISVLFFSLVVLIFWLYTRKLAKTAVLLALC